MRAIADVGHLWEPSGPYLNTASFGLPPTPAWEALQRALADWRHGSTSWEQWCEATERSREHFAELVRIAPERVATGASVSYLVGLVGSSVPDGARVLVPDVDFSSLTWPFLVHGERLDIRSAPLGQLADAIDEATDVVAFSAVQSSDGTVADMEAIADAAAAHGAFSVVDATHAVGWLPLDAARFDAVACAAYKWLMSPRGTAFLALSERALEQAPPLAANWFAADDPFGRYYDPELRLTEDARRARSLARVVLVGRHRAGAPAAVRAGRGAGPRARPRAGEPLPRPARPRAGQLGHRLRRPPGGRGAAAGRRHPGLGPERRAAGVLPRLQHGGGRGRRPHRAAGLID